MKTQLEDTEKTISEQVCDHITHLIATSGLKRGDSLPSYRELERKLGVGRMTVKAALDSLSERGIIRRQRARGCYVNREISTQGKPLKTVGIVHTASYELLFSMAYLREIMAGIGAGPQPLDVQIFAMRGDGFVTAALLAERHVDGVILLGLESDAFVEEFVTWGVPGVLVDQVSERIELDCVACDNAAAGLRAVQRLAALGHRRIRYITGDPRQIIQIGGSRTLLTRSSDRIERREAVARALAAVPGMVWDETIMARVDDQGLVHGVADGWLREAERPTVLLVENEMLGASLAAELAAMGIAVPEQLSICAVAGAGGAAAGEKALTGNRFDFTGMGRKAVELLRQRCEEPTAAPAPRVCRFGSEWEEGSTCGTRA